MCSAGSSGQVLYRLRATELHTPTGPSFAPSLGLPDPKTRVELLFSYKLTGLNEPLKSFDLQLGSVFSSGIWIEGY